MTTGDAPMVSDRFPATKFAPQPFASGGIERRAFDLLERGVDHPVVIVRGFPGSGKTTLVAGWTRRWRAADPNGRAVAWMSCDEADGDPGVLWHALATALHQSVGFELDARLAERRQGPPEEAAAILVNELIRHEGELVIVIDEAERAGHAISTLGALMERIPPGVRFVFTTRVELPLPLQQLRVRRLVGELHQSDLGLTLDESRRLLDAAGVTVDAEALRRFRDDTEGWLAPYVLVTSDETGDAASFISLGSGNDAISLPPRLEEFFFSLLADQEPAVQTFLLDLALLDECTATASRAIIDRDAGDELLRQVCAQGLFVVPADDGRGYRLHHLFRSFLKRERSDRDADRDLAIHHRAAEWYANNGDARRSIRHRIAGGDVEGALAAIGALLHSTGGACGDDGLAGWLAEIDGDDVRQAQSPEATALYALALVAAGQSTRGRQWLQALDGALAAEQPGIEQIRSFGWMGICWQQGDAHGAERHRDRIVELQSAAARESSTLEMVLAIDVKTWLDDFAAARHEYELHQRRAALADASPIGSVFVDSTFAYAAAAAGDLVTAQSTSHRTVERAREVEVAGQWPVTSAWRALGLVAYEQGRLDDAHSILSRAAARGEGRAPSAVLLNNVALARVELALGNVEETLRLVRLLTSALAGAADSPLADLAVSIDIRAALALGDMRRARDLVGHVRTPWRAAMLTARVGLATGEIGQVASELDGVEIPDTTRARIDLYVLRAWLARRRKDPEATHQWLDKALDLAIPETAVRPFFEDGLELWPILRQALSTRPRHDFHEAAAAMERHCRSQRHRRNPHGSDADGSVLASLRPREVEVLRLIGQRLSNAEIAAMLYISPNTLKTHTRALYRKLGVSRRSEAIALAEDLNMP